jgi:DNA-binding NarL/FixJ family response regulator
MSEPPIRVLLVDDHRVLRTGLRLILDHADGIECVGEAASAEEALHVSDRTHPDVIVMDVQMPGMGGIAGTRSIRERHPDVHVVMLSMFDAAEDVRAAFAAGAQGYLIKTAAEDELVDALRAVVHGQRYLHPALGAALAQPAPPDPLDGLTEREREVLQLLALGYGNQEIANRLHLSPRTVETHRANMMNKLRITSRADIVRVALAAGILSADTAEHPGAATHEPPVAD